jgi:ribonucleoside-diphosphate reductase alpha chain
MTKSFEELSIERKEGQAKGHYPDWYTTQSYQMFTSKYAVEGEHGLKGRHKTIAKTLASYMTGQEEYWEDKFFEIMWKGWLSPASPVLANTGTDRGLSVSCSGQYIADSVDSFYTNRHEAAMLTKHGFGCSGYFGDIRPRGTAISVGGKASGAVPVMNGFFQDASEVSQGSNRRGAFAGYIEIDHKDFWELQELLENKPDGKNVGWIITDDFIAKLKTGDPEANKRFTASLYTKLVTGRGYYFFKDKADRHRPQSYKDLNLDIKASNLCSEIMLHSSEKLSFSCVLSSMNLAKYDEWKNTDAVFTATVFLDCVVSDFLEKSKHIPGMDKVRKFTEKGRAVGLGVMGFSTYLQTQMIPFDSFEAALINRDIFKHIHDQSLEASKWMAKELGEPEWLKGYGERMTHRTALAPTKSTALLMGGVSESVFPDPGMVFELGSAAGNMQRINPQLYKLMKERGVYNKQTIRDILEHIGSVQHVTWLTDHEKEVFKTAFEVDQYKILKYASQRQKYICQGQSLNFFVSEDGDESRIADLHTQAFLDENILSLYYLYSRSGVTLKSNCEACEA